MSKLIIGFSAAVLSMSTATLAHSDFQKWMNQQQSDFQEYKDKRDKEFTAFLKQNWKQLDLLQGVERDKKPKPVSMPVASPITITEPAPQKVPMPQTVTAPKTPTVPVPGSQTPIPGTPKPVVKPTQPPKPVVTAPPAIVTPPPVVPPTPQITKKPPVPVVPPVQHGKKLNINFYGQQLTVFYDPKLQVSVPATINKQGISDVWSTLSRADYEPLVNQLNTIKQQQQLNDWAFAVLVDEVTQEINTTNNARTFLNWFVLIKAGYEARIAYDKATLYLLLPTRQPLYAVPYFTFDGIRFYAVNFDGKETNLGRVYTYDGRYPGATAAMDMRLTSDMLATQNEKQRKLSFDFKGKNYTVNARYDKERVAFFNTYPQLDLDLYFTAKLADSSASSLHVQLAGHIKDMSQLDAVNFLLRFVQTSLQYKTDDVQFGKENYLFPEETLHYRYSDCEDRSVLFAWLVRDLLGLEVVGLDFPGHVAAAVLFTVPVSGDKVNVNGKQFTVTDPTYINAVAGMTMPEYKKTKPKVISIN